LTHSEVKQMLIHLAKLFFCPLQLLVNLVQQFTEALVRRIRTKALQLFFGQRFSDQIGADAYRRFRLNV